jgi:hypothetical protein
MSKLRGIVLGTILAAALGTACVVTVWWEGSESSISFSWTVNGASPATSCSTVGATHVRMWISQYLPSCSLENESCGVWERAWDWNCTDGTASTGMQFAAVNVYVGWTLLDASGSVLSWTAWQPYTLQPGNNPLGTVAFTATPHVTGDAAVVSTWTIDGAAGSAATCTAAGASRVYLTYREAGTTTDQAMYWDCAPAGAATTGNIFLSGHTYELRWELKDAAGTTLSAAPGPTTWHSQLLVAGDNPFRADFVLTAVPDAHVTSNWTINSVTADDAACTAANAVSVVLVYQESGGSPSEVSFGCADGTGATATLFVSGTAYQLRWELRMSDGTVLSAAPGLTTWQDVTPVAGDNPVNVDLPVTYGRLDATLQWADKVTSPAWGDCALPPQDVAVIGYLFSSTTGTVMDEVDIDTSPVACVTALAWAGVPYGSYHLQVDGRAASPATATWGSDCVGLAVDDLLDNTFSCQVPMLTP